MADCAKKVFGIEVINEPVEGKLQALAAGAWFVTCTILGYLSLYTCIYLLFTQYWWLILPYLCWIYIDRDTCHQGGRKIKWIQNLAWWRYMKDYFPGDLKLSENFHIDARKNYLFCCFPHGVLPVGPFINITIKPSKFQELYPEFRTYQVALTQLFLLPFTRELGLGLGAISCSADSLRHVLTKPQGGNIAVLTPGGAEEAAHAFPGKYKFVLKNRKGFVKIALRTGASLVPVISFGETDVFDQIEGTYLRKVQRFVKKYLGFTPVVAVGRGFFQKTFGLIPRKVPVTTVVGKPIDVIKAEVPTEKQVNELHLRFIEEIVNLFETYKHQFVKNPDGTFIEIV